MSRCSLTQEIARLEAELKFRKADLRDLDNEVIEYYNNAQRGKDVFMVIWESLSPFQQTWWREDLRKSKMTKEELLTENAQLRKELEAAQNYSATQDERYRREQEELIDRYAGQD